MADMPDVKQIEGPMGENDGAPLGAQLAGDRGERRQREDLAREFVRIVDGSTPGAAFASGRLSNCQIGLVHPFYSPRRAANKRIGRWPPMHGNRIRPIAASLTTDSPKPNARQAAETQILDLVGSATRSFLPMHPMPRSRPRHDPI